MRILVCANPDLNYIDGSSVWSQTVTKILAQSDAELVDFVAKSKPERRELFCALDEHDNIRIIDGTLPGFWCGKKSARLLPEQMLELAVKLDNKLDYDLIVVRGYQLAKLLIDKPSLMAKSWIYLTDIPQSRCHFGIDDETHLQAIATGCKRLLCQSEGFVNLWREAVPNLDETKVSLYTPVIPDFDDSVIPVAQRENKAVYAGKFKKAWHTLDMARAWTDLSPATGKPQLVMIGDKIHEEPDDQSFKPAMINALEKGSGVKWLGALSREGVHQQLAKAKLGLSWRCEAMNDTLEYSTKVLEYGAAGCGAIINRNTLHERLFGTDYPLFANSEEEFIVQVSLALSNNSVLQKAADRIRRVAKSHTVSSRLQDIKDFLQTDSIDAGENVDAKKKRLKTVLVAGHDLKFFHGLQKRLEESGKYRFIIDQWSGHNRHDEQKSFELLLQADIIFCEWCLGNLQWYSRYKLPYQKLLARFHGQEIRLNYIEECDLKAVDHIGFVSDWIRQEAIEAKSLLVEKTSVIPNFLDDRKFTPRKKMGDARFTLGMIGITPKIKRFDRALDLLELLLESDSRYLLRIKGMMPFDYPWVKNRSDELEFYLSQMHRINSSEILRYKVVFDPPGDDVNEWLSLVGCVLSPSESETFHMAIGEGMLAGVYPVIWNRTGAEELWWGDYLVDNENQAANLIFEKRNIDLEAQAHGVRSRLQDKFPSVGVTKHWLSLFID